MLSNKDTQNNLRTALLMKSTLEDQDFLPGESFKFEMSNMTSKDDEMQSSGEEERRQKKKELNRLAAQRSREKRRNLIRQLETQVSELETANRTLTSEITNMRSEVSQLDWMLQNHRCVIPQQH